MSKTKIKIGGTTCNLEDMPESFANAIKNKMKESGLTDLIEEKKETNIIKDEKKKNLNVIEKKSLFRKCFGYKSGIFERFCKKRR